MILQEKKVENHTLSHTSSNYQNTKMCYIFVSLAPDLILCMGYGPGAPSWGAQIYAMLQFSSVIVFVILAAAAKFVY